MRQNTIFRNKTKQFSNDSSENVKQRKFCIKYYDPEDMDWDPFFDIKGQEKKKEIADKLSRIDTQINEISLATKERKDYNLSEYQKILDIEREKINSSREKSIENLKTILITREREKNFDYKGEWDDMKSKLEWAWEEIRSEGRKYFKEKKRQDTLWEDKQFYNTQLNTAKEWNGYWRFRIDELRSLYADEERKRFETEEANKLNDMHLNSNMNTSNNEITQMSPEEQKSHDNKDEEEHEDQYEDEGEDKWEEKKYEKDITPSKDTFMWTTINEKGKIKNTLRSIEKKMKGVLLNFNKRKNLQYNLYKKVKHSSTNQLQVTLKNIIHDYQVSNIRTNQYVESAKTKVSHSSSISSINYSNINTVGNTVDRLKKEEKRDIMILFLENWNVKKIIFNLLYNIKK